MEVGNLVCRTSQPDTEGEIIAIVNGKATVRWVWSGNKSALKLSALQPYKVRTEREKILAQIASNKRILARRGNTPEAIRYYLSENKRLNALINPR